jgi:hypothetical protein
VLFEPADKRDRMAAFLERRRESLMSLPELVGVYGGGRMGAGIAHAFLVAIRRRGRGELRGRRCFRP